MIAAPRRPEVLNARVVGKSRPGAVYIGRPGPWGNPFSIGKHGSRDEVIAAYIGWLHDNPDVVARARRDLRGLDLICWCAPASCHGHILRDLALGNPLPPREAPRQPRLL
ncbi:hypothetical protein OCH239_09715 [Roseivivax halodurans JCM 10272]|uniref:DUF4326 domain-containing protein n=1 Tax=Roseivivax halodurans JCM 10272 TaxID=1449350 RepID=X7EEA8_9RHOB|nr:DUF4326 domain-containing protein [Roseivivax halodurans]ETX13546.1 hypothetical protein OCH239_09715 [Roseivivax halodurans JCM 10272]